jgi:hypothetical protein
LHKQKWNKELDADKVKETTSTLMALALRSGTTTAESIQIAHERDMALYRDMLVDNDNPESTTNISTTLLSANIKLDLIAPAEELLSVYRESMSEGNDMAAHSDAPHENTAASTMSSSSSSKNRLPKKATTAAAFFGDKGGAGAGGKKKSVLPAKGTKTVAKAKKPTSDTKDSVTATIPKKSTAVTATIPKKASTTVNKKANEQDEKENNAVDDDDDVVGNADNFVGDLDDDDDDDDVDEVVMQEPAIVRENKASSKRRAKAIQDDDDDGEDNGNPVVDKRTKQKEVKPKPPVTGAMDAFATTSQSQKSETSNGDGSSQQLPKKRRRKKMVEKTTMDQSGYLHTETQEIWEDVPSDEEEPVSKIKAPPKLAPVKKKKGAANGKSDMKQGNLMGFFKKK